MAGELSFGVMLLTLLRGGEPRFGRFTKGVELAEELGFDAIWTGNSYALGGPDSFAMLPTASVSGFYFSHPDARYFGVGRIGRDQVEDYARRKGMPVAEVERWLASNLAYTPERG